MVPQRGTGSVLRYPPPKRRKIVVLPAVEVTVMAASPWLWFTPTDMSVPSPPPRPAQLNELT